MRGHRFNRTRTFLTFDPPSTHPPGDSESKIVLVEPSAAHICAGSAASLLPKLLSDTYAGAGSPSLGNHSSVILLATLRRPQPLLDAIEQQLPQFPSVMSPPAHPPQQKPCGKGRFARCPACFSISCNHNKAAAVAAPHAGAADDDNGDNGHFTTPDTSSAAHHRVMGACNADRDASSQRCVWKIMYSSAIVLGSITALLLLLPLLLPAPLPSPPLELLLLPLFILLLLTCLALSPPLSPAVTSSPSLYPEPAH